MREIEFKTKLYSHTRYAVECIAWATNRRGRNAWESGDVVGDIYDYCVRNGVKMETPAANGIDVMSVNKTTFRRAVDTLIREGLATAKRSSSRKFFIHFEFLPDVILTGHGVDKATPPAVVDPATEQARIDDMTAAAVLGPLDLPLPELPFKPYRHNDLLELLRQWQRKDAEAHADYIDRLIDTLTIVLDG